MSGAPEGFYYRYKNLTHVALLPSPQQCQLPHRLSVSMPDYQSVSNVWMFFQSDVGEWVSLSTLHDISVVAIKFG